MAEPDTATGTKPDLIGPAQDKFGASEIFCVRMHDIQEGQMHISVDVGRPSCPWFGRTEAVVDENPAVNAAIPVSLITSVAGWQIHSLEQIAETFQDWVALCSRCALHIAGNEPGSDPDAAPPDPESRATGAVSLIRSEH